MSDLDEAIICRSYTHARRYPMVLGRIGGWAPPFQLSVTQIAVLLASLGLAIKTWRIWAGPLPDLLAVMLLLAGPILLTWSVRRVRVEGRSLPRAALGWIALWSAPRSGTVAGRPHRDPAATTWTCKWVVIHTGTHANDLTT